jgi:diguanylate cyclase (GGDEF)-like protein/PAS domain S-box-containing protein
MSLRAQVVLGISAVGVIVLALLFTVISPRVSRAFLDIERSDVRRNVDRARNAIATELSALESTIHDWAAWDDTVSFVEGKDRGYADSNLLADTFTNLRLNDMVFYDAAGRLVEARGFNLEEDEPTPPSESELTALALLAAQSRKADGISSRAGLVSFDGELALVAVHPILNSPHEPPVQGTLVFVRLLTRTEIERLAGQVSLSLQLRGIDDPGNDSELLAELLAKNPPASVVVPLNAQSVAGYAVWRDTSGAPIALLSVEVPRDAYRAGAGALRYLIISITALFVGLATAFLYFLDRRVLSRTAHLTHDVVRIADAQDTSRRVWVTGKDELAQLGTNINGMLASIEESRVALAKSERQYHNLFESSRDPIYITTEDGRFIDVNPAFVDLLGYTKEEVMTKTAGEFYVHPEDRDAFQAAIAENGFVTSFPVTLKRKDGVQLRCLLTTALEAPSGSEKRVYQGIIRDVTELLRQQEEVAFLAAHDPLTGLLSRGALYDVLRLEIARAMRNLDRLAVFYLDLDRFKEVNDTHGHAAGDHVLQEVSVRLRDVLRASDTVARLGGDEFVALLPGIDSPRDAEIAADKILQALRDSFEIPEDGSFDLSASIGIALFPDDGESGAHLLQRADAAMYVAKAEGRDGWRRYRRGAPGPSQS